MDGTERPPGGALVGVAGVAVALGASCRAGRGAEQTTGTPVGGLRSAEVEGGSWVGVQGSPDGHEA